MVSFGCLAEPVPAMSRRLEAATPPSTPRALAAAGAQRRTSKAREFGAQRPRGGRLTGSGFAWPGRNLPAGEILSPQRLAAATAGSSGHRDMQGRACRTPTGSRLADHSLKGSSTQPAPDLAPGPSKPCFSGEPRSIPVDGSQSVKAQRSVVWIEVRLMQARESAATRSQAISGQPFAIRQIEGL